MRSLRVRPAVVDDIPSIQSVARESWSEVYRWILPSTIQQQALSAWYSDESLKRSIESPASFFFVAEAGQQIIGFAQFVVRSRESAKLGRLYVTPQQQRGGIGSALLRSGIAALRARNVERITVATELENNVGRRFYERSGFSERAQSVADLFGYQLKLVTYERSI